MKSSLFELYVEAVDYLCRYRNSNSFTYLSPVDRERIGELAEAIVLMHCYPNLGVSRVSDVLDIVLKDNHLQVFSDFFLKTAPVTSGEDFYPIMSLAMDKRHRRNCVSYQARSWLNGVDEG